MKVHSLHSLVHRDLHQLSSSQDVSQHLPLVVLGSIMAHAHLLLLKDQQQKQQHLAQAGDVTITLGMNLSITSMIFLIYDLEFIPRILIYDLVFIPRIL